MNPMSVYKRVECEDGFSVSIQARSTSYCEPRVDGAEKYHSVELGFPSHEDELIMPYAEMPERPLDTVYGYVPVSVVNLLIAKHGGIVAGNAPPGVTPLYCKGYKK